MVDRNPEERDAPRENPRKLSGPRTFVTTTGRQNSVPPPEPDIPSLGNHTPSDPRLTTKAHWYQLSKGGHGSVDTFLLPKKNKAPAPPPPSKPAQPLKGCHDSLVDSNPGQKKKAPINLSDELQACVVSSLLQSSVCPVSEDNPFKEESEVKPEFTKQLIEFVNGVKLSSINISVKNQLERLEETLTAKRAHFMNHTQLQDVWDKCVLDCSELPVATPISNGREQFRKLIFQKLAEAVQEIGNENEKLVETVIKEIIDEHVSDSPALVGKSINALLDKYGLLETFGQFASIQLESRSDKIQPKPKVRKLKPIEGIDQMTHRSPLNSPTEGGDALNLDKPNSFCSAQEQMGNTPSPSITITNRPGLRKVTQPHRLI